ncbi:subunit of the Arp2/3 complex [Mycoemilia scoparia]|uniref:Actin-related protein 2/3 complex subunit 3 n=1 Tax=Mycoemilia scoparia TaxID=417184 RepID=A0A9W7ZZA9_9FUNG|nr:subunit of the Arp2/3 complex [Mycoemilia scoparia]
MPAYHSTQLERFGNLESIGGIPLVPLRTKTPGPAQNHDDAVDEALRLFRPNCFFKNFEIKDDGDRLLVYLILFISQCLGTLGPNITKSEAKKNLHNLAVSRFSVPGDPDFSLKSVYPANTDINSKERLRQYLQQARQETAMRLLDIVYEDNTPSKWWLSFQKRHFMGKHL